MVLLQLIAEAFSRWFIERHEVRFRFGEAAWLPLRKWFEQAFKDYEFGLKLTGREAVEVTADMIVDPRGLHDKLMKKSYRERGR